MADVRTSMLKGDDMMKQKVEGVRLWPGGEDVANFSMNNDSVRKTSTAEKKAQELFHTETRARAFYQSQMCGKLNEEMQGFISRQDMVFIATSDRRGNPDCSFRAGLPGFVKVMDAKTLCFPEYRGNGVMASVGNILDNPRIGMIFMDFYKSTVGLHVNGNAQVVKNKDIQKFEAFPPDKGEGASTAEGPHPECWVLIEVEEAYIHCSKHVPLLKKLTKRRHWGTDEERHKGGNFFNVPSSETKKANK